LLQQGEGQLSAQEEDKGGPEWHEGAVGLEEAKAGEAYQDGVYPTGFHGGEEEREEYFAEAGGVGRLGWAFK
jgi:hypothetical protein